MSRASSSEIKVMLDAETLSNIAVTAPMISLGAVKFLADGTIVDKFKVNIDAKDVISYGFKPSKQTIEWWKSQPEAMKSLLDDKKTLQVAMSEFVSWYGPKSLQTWVNGASFDFPIMDNHLNAVDMVVPWKYWDQNDYRTVLNIFNLDNSKLRKNSSNTYHDAVADCIAQVEILTTILRPLWITEEKES